MKLSLTTSGLLDPKRLDSWIPEKRRAIRKAVEAGMKSAGKEIAQTVQARMQSAFKVRKSGFVRSMRHKLYAGSPEKFPGADDRLAHSLAWHPYAGRHDWRPDADPLTARASAPGPQGLPPRDRWPDAHRQCLLHSEERQGDPDGGTSRTTPPNCVASNVPSATVPEPSRSSVARRFRLPCWFRWSPCVAAWICPASSVHNYRN
jgi:hypothetical protein